MEKTRQKKTNTRDILIIEEETEREREVKVELESGGFIVKDMVNNFEEAVKYIEKSRGEEPGFVIMELSSDGKLNSDFLFYLYSRWKNTKVYIFTAYIEYLELHPYLRNIVNGVFTKTDLPGLIASLKENV
jgi:DNA-binding NarL/FixJ family response regulator